MASYVYRMFQQPKYLSNKIRTMLFFLISKDLLINKIKIDLFNSLFV